MDKTEEIKTDVGKCAAQLLQGLLRSRKNLKIYPVNNPMYAKVVEESFRKLDSCLDLGGTIDLTITRNDILLGGEVVFKTDGKEENLALFFFRDGLRRLTFEEGLTQEEFQAFLEVISVDFDSEDVEEDLVTLMWEKDFEHIKYQVDESTLMDEDDNYEEEATEKAKEDPTTEGALGKAYHDVFDEEPFKGIIPVPVSDEDLKKLTEEIARDRQDKLPKLVDVLFDLLFSTENEEELKDVVRIMSTAIEYAVRQNNLNGAVTIFRRVHDMAEKARNEIFRRYLKQMAGLSSAPGLFKVIGEMLDSKEGIDEAVFKNFVSVLTPAAIPQLIKLLGELDSIGGRKALIYALTQVGRQDLPKLADGLKDSRWFVVRNVIIVLRQIGERRALDYLGPVGNHEDPRVRKEVLKLVGEMGGKAAVKIASAQLHSDDLSVAIMASQSLGKMGGEEAKAALLEKVMGNEFQDYELSEMKPFFESLARFRDKDVFQFCMGLLEKNPLFGRSKFNAYKACAIYALGLIGSPSALPTLEPLQHSKTKVISEYALSAIKRIQLYASKRSQ
jgi:HEAT repeat protein